MSFTGRGRFKERLKLFSIFKKKKGTTEDKKVDIVLEDSNKIYANHTKVMLSIPLLVYGALSNTKDNNIDNKIIDQIPDATAVIDRRNKRLQKRKIIETINVEKLKNNNEIYQSNKDVINQKVNNDIDKVKNLHRSIINLIKKDLIKIANEMEIIESELYILSEVNGENKIYQDCKEELDQVKAMICKIDKLKAQYDFLKDNYDFEYLLEIDNNDLVDKIIMLRDTLGNDGLKAVSSDYKLLDVYKYLYLRIDDLKDKIVSFEEEKNNEAEKLKERDIDFEKLKSDVYNVEAVNKNYVSFVNTQNELLRNIDAEVGKISSSLVVDHHLKGFKELFKNTFKYFGLLMISPLKGIIPSIATETLITGSLIKNLYNNLELEEVKRMHYDAIDYSNLIAGAINDLERTNNIVDGTLDDIVHLKMKYNDKFREYEGDFSEYHDIMNKINDMENKILGNKIKIEMMRKKALEQQKKNDKTLVMVKEMNKKENAKV